jgi:WD40 repeat protein
MIQQVAYCAFSPDGKRLTTGMAFTSRLWDVARGKLLAVFPGVNRPVVFTPDGTILATANEEVRDGKIPDGIVKLWDAATGKLLDTLKLEGQAKEHIAVAFSPDGKTLLTRGWSLAAGSGTVRLWDVATRKERATLKGLANLSDWKFSADSKTLALRLGDAVQLWDVATGKQRATLEKTDTLQPAGVMLFSPDGKTLATGGNNDNIKLWDVASGRLRATLKGARGNVVFNRNSKTVVTSAMGYGPKSDFKLWDVATGRELATLPSVQSQSVVFIPDSNTLVTVGMEAAVKLWDVAAAQEGTALETPPEGIRTMRFSPDGKTLATMMDSNEGRPRGQPEIDTVKLWDVTTGKELATLKGVGEAFFSPDSKIVVTTRENGIKLWDAATGRECLALWNKWFLAFSPDSKILVTVSDGKASVGKVQFWDAATGMERIALEGVGEALLGPDGKVMGMLAVFSPDGKILATQSHETVKLWDVATGKERTTLKGDGKVVFSPDGKVLVTEPRGGIKLWDAATGKERGALPGQWFMAFSPDSSLLATSDDVKDIRLWHLSPKNDQRKIPANSSDWRLETIDLERRCLERLSAGCTLDTNPKRPRGTVARRRFGFVATVHRTVDPLSQEGRGLSSCRPEGRRRSPLSRRGRVNWCQDVTARPPKKGGKVADSPANLL